VSDELRLTHIAAKLSEAAALGDLTTRLEWWLRLIDYFDDDEIDAVREQSEEWERRQEWERLKERGDRYNNENQPGKAYPLYRRAIMFEDNAELNNNIGVCLMKLDRCDGAVYHLEKARAMKPDNINIRKNLAEALIYSRRLERASEILMDLAESVPEEGLLYLYGEYSFENGNVHEAANFYERSLTYGDDAFLHYRLAEIYVKLRLFDRALEVMDRVADKDHTFLMKQADIYEACSNIPSAIKCIEKALLTANGNVRLWVMLARFYRLSYDNSRAELSIKMALDIEPDNEEALLESAKIKKMSGKTREYQQILKTILHRLKTKYRELNNEMDIVRP